MDGQTICNSGNVVLEEWSLSSSKPTRTCIFLKNSNGSFSQQRLSIGTRLQQAPQKLLAAFLPEGYPNSVTSDYLPFQIWDTLQGLSTYIRSMLSTHALLSAIGVGETTATVVGATFQWFLRDFTGMLAGIVFTLYQGSNLDSNAKMWRLTADFMNDLGMLMDLISPLYPACFVIILCLGSMARSFTGVASGATRAALTQHFALQQNAADISAKEGSQETLATMVGMLLGMLLAHATAGNPAAMWSSFLLLTSFHIFANYQAVRSLCLNTLNKGRISILLKIFLTSGQVLTPKDVSKVESVFPSWISLERWRTDSLRNAHIRLGVKLSCLSHADVSKLHGSSQLSSYGKGMYLLLHRNKAVDVILHKSATSDDILESYIHALVLVYYMRISNSSSNNVLSDSSVWMAKHYHVLIAELQGKGWNTQRLLVPSSDWRAQWN